MAKSYQHYHKQPKNIKQLLEKMSPEEREIYELRNQVAALQALPTDFRNVPEGSVMWETYYKFRPEKRLEMTRYKRGIWLHFQELSDAEKTFYGPQFKSFEELYTVYCGAPAYERLSRDFNWNWGLFHFYVITCAKMQLEHERAALIVAGRENWEEWNLKEDPKLFEVPMIKGLYIKGPDARAQVDTFNLLASITSLPIRFKREYTDEKGRPVGVAY